MFESFYFADGLYWALIVLSLLVAVWFCLAPVRQPGSSRQASGGVFLVTGLIAFIGLRPISGYYVDMVTYAREFDRSAVGLGDFSFGDPLFDLLNEVSAYFLTPSMWFFLLAIFYVLPKAYASKLLFGNCWPLALAIMGSSFSFYAYGTNGIRNGIAVSFCLIALATPKISQKLIWGLVSIGFHASVLITLAAHLIAYRLNSLRLALLFWVLTIPASIILPDFIGGWFVDNLGGARSAYFSLEADDGGGFRLDFLLYGASGAAAICYWKFFKRVSDPKFDLFAATYLIANGFWIMINDVAFSNRFAFLSWFMLELVLIFPMLRRPQRNEMLPLVLAIISGNAILRVLLT